MPMAAETSAPVRESGIEEMPGFRVYQALDERDWGNIAAQHVVPII
jgi:hypothetical protein